MGMASKSAAKEKKTVHQWLGHPVNMDQPSQSRRQLFEFPSSSTDRINPLVPNADETDIVEVEDKIRLADLADLMDLTVPGGNDLQLVGAHLVYFAALYWDLLCYFCLALIPLSDQWCFVRRRKDSRQRNQPNWWSSPVFQSSVRLEWDIPPLWHAHP